MVDINAFAAKWIGKVAPAPDGSYVGECVSLVKQWFAANDWPYKHGNAINWQYNGNNGYVWVKNYVWTVPRPGDAAVFQVGAYGHIGIVVSANIRSMQVLNQNWPHGTDIDPVAITTFNYRNPKCIGFLRKI